MTEQPARNERDRQIVLAGSMQSEVKRVELTLSERVNLVQPESHADLVIPGERSELDQEIAEIAGEVPGGGFSRAPPGCRSSARSRTPSDANRPSSSVASRRRSNSRGGDPQELVISA